MTPLGFTEWDSGAEMLEKHRKKSLLKLGTESEGIYKFFSANLAPENDDFGIVIFSSGHGGPAGVLFDDSQS